MAVFTNLSEQDFIDILANYEIGQYASFSGISEGVENTNYKLETSKAKYILTIYEKRVNPQDLPFFMNLQSSLNQVGFPCPMPIKNKQGKIINQIKEKNFTIVSFLNGKWPKSISTDEVKKAGEILAKFHNISKNLPEKDFSRKNTMSIDFWQQTYSKVQDKAEQHFPDLAEASRMGFEKILSWPINLPSGVIHADFFPDNVLFYQNEISGVIDFYMSCRDFLAYDLAITLNSWCFEKDNSFNITKAKNLLSAYNKVRKLSDEELENLPVLCVGASLRFLSTRLYDFFNRSDSAMVSVKDPKEYIEKLKFHLQAKSYNEYGI